MREYDLTKVDILAALDYAAKSISAEEIKVLPLFRKDFL